MPTGSGKASKAIVDAGDEIAKKLFKSRKGSAKKTPPPPPSGTDLHDFYGRAGREKANKAIITSRAKESKESQDLLKKAGFSESERADISKEFSEKVGRGELAAGASLLDYAKKKVPAKAATPAAPKDKTPTKGERKATLQKQKDAAVTQTKKLDRAARVELFGETTEAIQKTSKTAKQFSLSPEEKTKLLTNNLAPVTKKHWDTVASAKSPEEATKEVTAHLKRRGLTAPTIAAVLLAGGISSTIGKESPEHTIDEFAPDSVLDEQEKEAETPASPDPGKTKKLFEEFSKAPPAYEPPEVGEINSEADMKEALSVWKTELGKLRDEYRADQKTLARRETWEKIVNAVAQLGASLYGLQKGLPIGQIDFTKTDWGREYTRLRDEYSTGRDVAKDVLTMSGQLSQLKRQDRKEQIDAYNRSYAAGIKMWEAASKQAHERNLFAAKAEELRISRENLDLKKEATLSQAKIAALKSSGTDLKEANKLNNEFNSILAKAMKTEIGTDERQTALSEAQRKARKLLKVQGYVLPDQFWPQGGKPDDLMRLQQRMLAWEEIVEVHATRKNIPLREANDALRNNPKVRALLLDNAARLSAREER